MSDLSVFFAFVWQAALAVCAIAALTELFNLSCGGVVAVGACIVLCTFTSVMTIGDS